MQTDNDGLQFERNGKCAERALHAHPEQGEQRQSNSHPVATPSRQTSRYS
jgi:hypothetical protein